MKGSGLVTASAMEKVFNSTVMAKVLIVGGLCGVVTSWNSFLIGGSRAIFSMAESRMIPGRFSILNKKHKTPVNALLLIGFLSLVAPFFGRTMLVWISDAASFACCLAYCMVSMSFVILRKKEPDLPRPYKVKNYRFVGITASILSGMMVVLYLIPGSGCSMTVEEWIIVGGWAILGLVFYIICKRHYGEKFGQMIV
jgi:amino acid transporter